MKLTDYESNQKDCEKAVTDPRLRDEPFKQKVRIVFNHLGIQNTMRNFKHYDPMIDWEKTANSLQNPKHLAVVRTLWAGQPCDARSTIIELSGKTREHAIKKLNKKHYLFERWFA